MKGGVRLCITLPWTAMTFHHITVDINRLHFHHITIGCNKGRCETLHHITMDCNEGQRETLHHCRSQWNCSESVGVAICASRDADLRSDVSKRIVLVVWMLHGLGFGGKRGHETLFF